MTAAADNIVLVCKIYYPPDALPFDVGAMMCGGSLMRSTHAGDFCDARLSSVRTAWMNMRLMARMHGQVELSLPKLLRKHQLLDWAEKHGAKILLPTPDANGWSDDGR